MPTFIHFIVVTWYGSCFLLLNFMWLLFTLLCHYQIMLDHCDYSLRNFIWIPLSFLGTSAKWCRYWDFEFRAGSNCCCKEAAKGTCCTYMNYFANLSFLMLFLCLHLTFVCLFVYHLMVYFIMFSLFVLFVCLNTFLVALSVVAFDLLCFASVTLKFFLWSLCLFVLFPFLFINGVSLCFF